MLKVTSRRADEARCPQPQDCAVTVADIDRWTREFGKMLTRATWRAIKHDRCVISDCRTLLEEDGRIEWSDERGVYYFTDARACVLYVGGTRVSQFGARFRDHGKKYDAGEEGWRDIHGCTMIRFAAHVYFATALESYILSKRMPPLNRTK